MTGLLVRASMDIRRRDVLVTHELEDQTPSERIILATFRYFPQKGDQGTMHHPQIDVRLILRRQKRRRHIEIGTNPMTYRTHNLANER